MKIFLDTIDINEIKKYQHVIDGITTNPSLIAKALDASPGTILFTNQIKEIFEIVQGDISIQVTSFDYENMVEEGEHINSIGKHQAVIKIPLTWDGLAVCKHLSNKNYKVNMTLCFTANQALLAAKAGATYVSPFVGRLQDEGEDGIKLIADIRKIFDQHDFGGRKKTQILASSIRTLEQVTKVAINGADVVTLPVNIMEQLMEHKLSGPGLQRFKDDAAKFSCRKLI